MQRTEILRAFKQDCIELIKSFAKCRQPFFKYFCVEWKRMNFQYIFL